MKLSLRTKQIASKRQDKQASNCTGKQDMEMDRRRSQDEAEEEAEAEAAQPRSK